MLFSSFRLIWIPMVCFYNHYYCLIFTVRGSALDVRFWRLRTVPRVEKGWKSGIEWTLSVNYVERDHKVNQCALYCMITQWYIKLYTLNNIGSLEGTIQYYHHAIPGEPLQGSPGVAWWLYWRVLFKEPILFRVYYIPRVWAGKNNQMLPYVLVQEALGTITLYLVAIPFNDRRYRAGKTINIRPYDKFMMRIGWTQLDVILITSLMGVKLKDTYCPFGYKRVYLPGNKVADTPFHIEGDNVVYLNNDVVND